MEPKAWAYVVLIAYPAITLLIYEPNELRWWWRTGGGVPMPPKVLERSKRNQGNLLIVKFLSLILASSLLMRSVSVSPASLGLRLRQPTGAVLLGVAGGILFVLETLSLMGLAKKITSRPSDHVPIFVVRESTSKIISIIVIGGFAEEFWRALALTAFGRAGFPTEGSVLLTSLFFGIGHVLSFQSLGAAIGRALRPAIGGIFLAALFLWSGTLLAPFIAHIVVNSLAALMQRKHALATETGDR